MNCTKCDNKGWFYNPEEDPDPIEGYKQVTRIKCDCIDEQKSKDLDKLGKIRELSKQIKDLQEKQKKLIDDLFSSF